MKVRMIVRNKGPNEDVKGWEETFDSETTRCLAEAADDLTATQYGQLVIDYFNSTLKPGEKERVLVQAADAASFAPHADAASFEGDE